MQYGMRALLILMAIVPPAGFVAFLFFRIHPALVAIPFAWCAAFTAAVTRKPQIETPLGLTPAELLVIVAIGIVVAALSYDPMFFLSGVRY